MFLMMPCELGTAFLGTFLAVEKSTSPAGANTGNAEKSYILNLVSIQTTNQKLPNTTSQIKSPVLCSN